MTRPLVWYDEQESGIELGELWDLLARHGFVDVPLAFASSVERARVEAFAADLHVELVRSEVERMRVPVPESEDGGDWLTVERPEDTETP